MIKNKSIGKSEFTEKFDDQNVVRDLIDDFCDAPDDAFFPYINLLDSLDLTRYQIYNSIHTNNYRDNCFVYAYIQLGVFNDDEIHKLATMMLTRSIPNKKILEIAIEMKWHFNIYKIDENRDIKHQKHSSIDTCQNSKVVADREVQLLLYKEHYMIDHIEKLPITKYFIEHKAEIDKKYSDVPITDPMLINNNRGDKSEGTGSVIIMRTMFKCGYFREINQCEQEILSTCEFDNHLNDYTDHRYDTRLRCKPESIENKKITERSHIYNADNETNVTVSPHKPYLLCLYNDKHTASFEGSNITSDSVKLNSLTYFHNLKFDTCFFINENGRGIQLIQHSCTFFFSN